MTTPTLLDCVEHETGQQPTHSVIWLHGLGADGHDFAPIVPELRLPASLAVRFVFPHASIQPVTINGGMAMRSWYDILTPNLVKREDEVGIRVSEQAVQALIARENARGVPSSRIVLAGFSQGCAMTLHTGIRFREKLAGLMGLSGYLPLIDMAAQERHSANATTPIFLAHGTHDPVVTLERAEASRAKLVDLGYVVQWHTYPMPHSVCAQEIDDISSFLQSVLL
ncbi:dienelactone hydrolase family protein [Alcaligenaceae bacterium LF4-65]|jgi:phospholipase/carboxylesterase|uniref:Dienelactone hydrolase family protein n=1 Tax=Zwartia hollandica TaxID=324606 RepID=A0A953N9G9_9BURK|nr:alpha/beta hydrolase [Zwartia hollandica]MBZ1350428.1 dienelactone hydrolase family protein [Zwartia hollandica]